MPIDIDSDAHSYVWLVTVVDFSNGEEGLSVV